ncbi:MAG: NAD(P)H-binding protein [Solirubrobacterales bacterium]
MAGSTGYVGRALALRLAEQGRAPRCLARDPTSAGDLAEAGCQVVAGDVLEPETLAPALEGIDVAYYLVHSMGRGASGDFAARDRRGAGNFARAAREAGVEQIIYLGGLAEGGSTHLESRHETAAVLASGNVPVTYLRAAAVIGAGSESCLTVYHLVKRLPAMVTPRWTETKTQPIGIDDVIEYLAVTPQIEAAAGRTIEIGGPDVVTYGGMMDAMADAMGVRRRPRIPVPLLTPWLSSLWIGLVTPVDAEVARPLVEGLSAETVVGDPSGMALFDVTPTPIAEAMRRALDNLSEGRAARASGGSRA